MKALLKSNTKFHKAGEWVEIETTCLFNNQYNTDKERIFDRQISRIVDDARPGMGKCKYCGKMIRRGEEEKHFTEEEKKTCDNCGGKACFWWNDRIVKTERGPRNVERRTGENGEIITTTTQTVTEYTEKYCSYVPKYGTCSNKEHRKMGVEWFTPENTFFLKYPNGFADFTNIDRLKLRGFEVVEHGGNNENYHWFSIRYMPKLGTYSLEAINHVGADGRPVIDYFRVRNCRNWFDFRIENGEIFTDRYAMGWRKVKTLEKIPAKIMAALTAICNNMTNEESEAC